MPTDEVDARMLILNDVITILHMIPKQTPLAELTDCCIVIILRRWHTNAIFGVTILRKVIVALVEHFFTTNRQPKVTGALFWYVWKLTNKLLHLGIVRIEAIEVYPKKVAFAALYKEHERVLDLLEGGYEAMMLETYNCLVSNGLTFGSNYIYNTKTTNPICI